MSDQSEVTIKHQSVGVVVPAYRGGPALRDVLTEICQLQPFDTATGMTASISEIIIVCDNPGLVASGPDSLETLASVDKRINIVWLSKNFGQHAATVAGIASSNSDWLVTLDEDGQHDPAYIPNLLRQALSDRSSIVYARPSEPPPHGFARNAASKSVKKAFGLISGTSAQFNSFRLVEGSLARAIAAYVGPNVYLDVALLWALGPPTYCPVPMRSEHSESGYSYRSLLSHFWRLVLSSGTRPLRLIAALGVLLAFSGAAVATVVAYLKLTGNYDAPGWASLMIVLLFIGGSLLVAIAILAEYVGYAVGIVMGKPLYLIANDPSRRAWARVPAPPPTPSSPDAGSTDSTAPDGSRIQV